MLAASAPRCKPPRATFAAFLRSSETRHALGRALQDVGDARRPGPRRVPMGAVLTAAVAGFASGLGAVRSWEDALRHRAPYRHLLRATGHTGTISDDTFALALASASLPDLQAVLRAQAKRELQRWSTGPHAESRLGRDLIKLGARKLAAWPVLAIDGHTLFTSQHHKCEACLPVKTPAFSGWCHKVVVAQWVGSHPAMVVDFEPIGPSDGESKDSEMAAAKRLLARVTEALPGAFRVLLLDALYDCEPMRAAIKRTEMAYVIRHKDPRRALGGDGVRAIQARDPEGVKPDGVFQRRDGQVVKVWQAFEAPQGRRTVAFRRPGADQGACVTNLSAAVAPPEAVATLMMERWSQENTGFHELAGQLKLDRAYVHKGRANAAWTVVAVAFITYNAWQAYLYRVLKLDPTRPGRTWGDLRRDMWSSLGEHAAPLALPITGPP